MSKRIRKKIPPPELVQGGTSKSEIPENINECDNVKKKKNF